MGFNAKAGSFWRIRVSTPAMEDTIKNAPPTPLFGHYAYGAKNFFPDAVTVFTGAVNGFLGATNVFPGAENPVESLHLFSFGSLSIEDKDRPPSSQGACSSLFAHSELFHS